MISICFLLFLTFYGRMILLDLGLEIFRFMVFKLLKLWDVLIVNIIFWDCASWWRWQLLRWLAGVVTAVFIGEIVAVWSELWWLAACYRWFWEVVSNDQLSYSLVCWWWETGGQLFLGIMVLTLSWSQWWRFLNRVFIAYDSINIKHGDFWNLSLWSVESADVWLWNFALDLKLFLSWLTQLSAHEVGRYFGGFDFRNLVN
mgnify:CR=1 FL=1